MDAFIDPKTAAYVNTGTDLQRDPARGLANAIYLRLVTPLGSYWANTGLGSRLHELARAKAMPNIDLLARQYARDALLGLLDDGRARSIDIATQLQPMADASKSLHLQITVVDASGNTVAFTHHVPVA